MRNGASRIGTVSALTDAGTGSILDDPTSEVILMHPSPAVHLLAIPVVAVLCSWLSGPIAAAEAPPDVRAAIDNADFEPLLGQLSAWLCGRVPAAATEESLRTLLDDPAFGLAIAQRQFIAKAGLPELTAFSEGAKAHREFLGWLLSDRGALEEVLLAATPVKIAAREENRWRIGREVLGRWRAIDGTTPPPRKGVPLRLAIATALRPPGTGSPGSGQKHPPTGPVERFEYFRDAHAAGELFPSFDRLTAWDMQYVVNSGASEVDLTWGRQMVRTWMPNLLDSERVVETTSQVWRRNSPIPHVDYKAVLDGGGKCGPRSSWSVFICQAFGVPACGVGQPAHACVAFRDKTGIWQVAYGRGWNASHLEGMSGPEFVAGTLSRSKADFPTVERLRWLAGALENDERQAAVMAVARGVDQAAASAPIDLDASGRADEADADRPTLTVPATKGDAKPETAAPPPAGVIRVAAADFAAQGGVHAFGGQYPGVPVIDSHGGGRQIMFQALMPTSWVGYDIDVPTSGDYRLTVKTAAVNSGQTLFVRSFGSLAKPVGATVSNVFHGMEKDLGAQMAIDGDPGTRWAANEGVDQCTLEIDLGSPTKISTCMIDERAFNRVSKYMVEYQADGEWKTLFEGDNIGIGFAKDFEPVTASRVRLQTLDCRERGGPTIWEFGVGAVRDGQAFIQVPCGNGLWTESEPVTIRLAGGRRRIWFFAPFQRGVAMKSFDLVPVGN